MLSRRSCLLGCLAGIALPLKAASKALGACKQQKIASPRAFTWPEVYSEHKKFRAAIAPHVHILLPKDASISWWRTTILDFGSPPSRFTFQLCVSRIKGMEVGQKVEPFKLEIWAKGGRDIIGVDKSQELWRPIWQQFPPRSIEWLRCKLEERAKSDWWQYGGTIIPNPRDRNLCGGVSLHANDHGD